MHKELLRARQSPETMRAARGGLSRQPGEIPQLWPYLASIGRSERSQYAAHSCFALFASHQYSISNSMSSLEVRGLGASARALLVATNFDPNVEQRILRVFTADEVTGVVNRLRTLIPFLRRGNGIQINYESLFWDLYNWPNYQKRAGIRRRWGMEMYSAQPADQPAQQPLLEEIK